MKKRFSIFLVMVLVSCSTGKKALQKGDYFSAVLKAVERLKSSPDNKNAIKVLEEGYPMTLEWSQEEMDLILTSNNNFKWEQAVGLMRQVNQLSDEIRSTPAARKIISDPKTYTSELKMATEKAAEDRYNAGLAELDINTRESARIAYEHFSKADELMNNYKNSRELMVTAKELATLRVVVQAIPVNTQRYRLSCEFFYNQVFEYLNNQFRPSGFVNFYSPNQAEKEQLKNPDFIVDMEFFDFSVGNLTHTEKEEKLERKVKIETRDTTKIEYKNYVAKLKTFSDQVLSGGSLRVRIIDPSNDKIMSDELVPGSFTWINEYAMFVGDKEALDNKQLELTKRKALPLPPEQDLFIEFTKPIYNQVTQNLNRFFRRFN
ncbi:MAG TPA: hypothetical protein VLQ91_05420 [Draconibacterium sp.]|nr:hypothetical protein [Draconibacterium sp.]